MAMPKKVYDLLKEKLGEEKIDDKSIIDLIESWEDAASAKEKVQTANKEISTERDQLKNDLKELREKTAGYESTVKEKDGEIEKLKTSQLTDEEKQKYMQFKENNGMTEDVQAQINKFQEVINGLNQTVETLTLTAEQEKQAAQTAKINEHNERLRSNLTNALNSKGVVGENAKIAISYMQAEGMAKLSEPDENGVVKEIYTVYKDNKPFTADSVTELVDHFASKHESLVSSSGRSGSGNNHNSNGNGDYVPAATTLEDMREAYSIKADYTT